MAFGGFLPRPRTFVLGAVGFAVGDYLYRFLIKESDDDPAGFIRLRNEPDPSRIDASDLWRWGLGSIGVALTFKMLGRTFGGGK